jgi:hypothetical protein
VRSIAWVFFGKCSVKPMSESEGRNSATGEVAILPAWQVVALKKLWQVEGSGEREVSDQPHRRQYPRRTAYLIVEYTVLEGTFRDFIKDIGSGGLFVRTSRKVAVGQPIKAKFPLSNYHQTVEAMGRVVRRDSDGFAVTFDGAITGLVCKDGQFPEIVHKGNR